MGKVVRAVLKEDKSGFWIISPGTGPKPNTAMNVWEVTSAGVNAVCKAFYPLPINTELKPTAAGYLRFSSDGKKFARGKWMTGIVPAPTCAPSDWSKKLFYGTFDPTTGEEMHFETPVPRLFSDLVK